MTCRHYLLAAAASLALAACSEAQEPEAPTVEREAEDGSERESETLPVRPVGRYAPRDECRDEPGASEFLNGLAGAAEARDTEALLALTKDDVVLDFGGGTGKPLLRERLADESYDLWGALDEILELGCASGEYGLTLPWYFAQQLDPIHDAYGSYLVTGNDVPLYASVDGEEVMRTLDWEMVVLVGYLEPTDEPEDASRWWVQLENETRGYVAEDQLRALIDYRVGAERDNGRWRIQYFIAGD